MNNIKRGEMFYISRGGVSYNGSEQHSDRPAVVVSNDKNNENSNVVEVVYMTTQPKTDLPTHVTVRSTGRPSTVLCEQVYSVSTERIGTYIGECSDKEMENIDIALMISLQLDGNMKTSKKYNETTLEYTGELNEKAKTALVKSFEEFGSGAKNTGKILPVPLGMKLTPLDIKLTDSQFFELKKYNALQIAGAFGVKPNQINDYSKSSYSNSEMQQLSFYVDTELFIIKQYEEENK